MQEYKGPIEQPDRFSDYLRQRLEDHRMPIEADGWEDIHTRLSRRTALHRRLVAAGVIVAALLSGLIWLTAPVDPPIPQEFAINQEATLPLPSAISSPALPSRSRLHTMTTPPDSYTQTAGDSSVWEQETEVAEEVLPQEPTKPTPTQTDRPGEATVPVDKNRSMITNRYTTHVERLSKSANHSSWLVAAGIGTGNNVSLDLYNYADPLDNNDYASGGDYPNSGSMQPSEPTSVKDIPVEKDYRDVTYHLPLSFSLMVRKNITPRFAVESGLVYTYLHNSYRSHNTLFMQSEYHLHYLGIPFNGVVYLYNQSRWNVYFAAGFMVEKNISAHYINTLRKKDYTTETLTGNPSIKGLQWSINSSLGVSYRIMRHWSLYAEPRFSYCFDTNQPETIRTEHPVTFGIGGGIRYEF